MQVNNIVAEERAKRSASDRQQKEADITARRVSHQNRLKYMVMDLCNVK